MPKPGEYPQPLLRHAIFQQPVVAGYSTIRLRADLQQAGSGSNAAIEDNLVMALVENTGNASASVQFRQTGNYESGARSSISPVISLIPGGRRTVNFTPLQQYVELWGVTGISQIKVQLDSQVPWTLMSFGRLDPTYPPSLWLPPSYNT